MNNPAPSSSPVADLPQPVQMLRMLAGLQVSQALYVVAKLDVATRLLSGPRTIEDLAAGIGANADVLERIVRVLAPMGLFRTAEATGTGKVELTSLGATLAQGAPGSVRDMAVFWMETHYAPFGQLLHTAVTGETAATYHYGEPFFDWLSKNPTMVEVQNRAMAVVTNGLRTGMFDGYALPPGGLVADIGGADGSMMVQLLARDPERKGIVFDLPEIVPAAETVLRDNGMADRVEAVAGDFFDAVPSADVYVLSYIMHDWDDASCVRILRSLRDASGPGARVVLVEAVIPPDDSPHPAKVVDLTMLGMMTGRERTAEQYEKLLAAAGVVVDRIVSTRSPFSFIEATVR
jgi:hypothetical protein